MFLRAAFRFRNILLLLAGIILALITYNSSGIPWLPVAFGAAGIAAYTAAVAGTLKSSKFIEEYDLSEKLSNINKLSWECNGLYRHISRSLDRNLRPKAQRVLKQKEELMNYFKKNCEDPIKQRIIEQALKLVIAYFNLAGNYSERMREMSQQNINELINRINVNNRKLGSLKNYEAVLELTKTIEMDEKLLQNIKEEREELEIANVRLEQIESTIASFKHRLLSSDFSDHESEEIENVINEATALDNALYEHSRQRQHKRI